MTECIPECLPRDATHSAIFAVVRCPSICHGHVDVSKRSILLSNFYFFIAWWPHHSSFPKGDPTVKFRRGHPQQERQIEVGYTKNLRFSTSISEIPIPNTEVFQNTHTEYRTDMKKYRRKYRIPIPTPNTDTDPALVTCPTFEAMGQIPMFHRTYFLFIINFPLSCVCCQLANKVV